ncbi:(2Fe-2S)-binding protein [Piscinibacter aquaticus]|uniref:Bacterioferritin-associated ferredoxin n=1 Tax=Piscinibacter aquaticus TaxID=392597 RepID=A0A5C6TXU1_9BURK|nr:(2Fe-2S)-binding protein [Piscinibacter aquaticus]
MIVCVCRRVSDHQIRQAVRDGAQTFEALQFELGVATQCGRCAECACQVMRDAKQQLAAEEESLACLQS